jgi:iron complex transport system ATP-binding protein
MSGSLSELVSVGYRAGEKQILRDISFSLQPGDFCLIFGSNGAGKTTLLRIMAGLLRNHTGQVRLRGQEVGGMSWRRLAQTRAYLGQSDEFSLPLSVRDVLVSGRYAYSGAFSAQSAQDQERISWAVDLFGLGPFLDLDIRLLSGGERKRVLIASAFVQDVEMVFLDEPLNFLDPSGANQVLRLLRDLNRTGRTIIVVSHALELFFPYINRMVALKNGQLLHAGAQAFRPDLFRQVYGVEYKQVAVGAGSLLYWHEP